MIERDRYNYVDWAGTFTNLEKGVTGMDFKKGMKIVFFVMMLFVLMFSAGSIFETVPAGFYQIKQAAISGTLSAKMDSGLWMQNFGDIFTFPKSETFFFTADTKEGKPVDESIEVTFADGSICNISGTARIMMPTTEKEALHLTADLGFRDYHSVEQKLILPTVRRALVLTATMMTAQESYNVKRPDFLKWASGQIEHGIAATDEVEKEIKDLATGETSMKMVKVIRVKDGQTVYESNPLEGTGIKLQNFEVKKFKYSPKVEEQIAKQQEAIMGVATAKADALKAEQAKITAEANGKAAVTTAQYAKETEKIQAVVDAQKVKEVAIMKANQEKEATIIDAEREKEKSRLMKDAAEFTKQEQILLGQGESERKRLVMEADGALEKKLEAAKYMADVWAKAYANRQVPAYYVEGGSGSGNMDNQSSQFMNMMNTTVAKNLGLDLSIQSHGKKQ